MKKILLSSFVAVAAIMAVGCSANTTTVVVKGDVDGLDGTVYVFNEDNVILDSVAVKNGRFTYKEEYVAPTLYSLRNAPEGPASFNTKVFVEVGTVNVALDPDAVDMQRGPADTPRFHVKVGGTPTNDAYAALVGYYFEMVRKVMADEELSLDDVEGEIDEVVNAAIEDNKDNYLGPYLLDKMKYYYSGHDLNAALDEFAEELQETKIVAKLRELAAQKVKTDIGEHFLEVIQNDPSGKPVSLSTVMANPRNKYVLLDFWASWCGPCMREVPYLVKTYTDFHRRGFEIYGVSHDTDGEKWQAAIKDNKLNWVHVSDLKRFDNQAAKDYAVMAIPSNFLIETKTGTIIAKNLRGEEVYETIAGLLK